MTESAAALAFVGFYWSSVAARAAIVGRRSGERIRLGSRYRSERALLAVIAVDVLVWFGGPILQLARVDSWIVRPLWRFPMLAWLGTTVATAALIVSWRAWLQMGDSWRMATTDRRLPLVTTGVFGRIRHPIYAMQACLMAGTALLVPSPLMVCLTLLHISALGAKTAIEERHLLAVYGSSYRDYMSRAGRFFPRPGL